MKIINNTVGNPHAICVYTDGSAKNNPGHSGQGIVICYPNGDEREICNYGYKISTNNRAELRACVDVLKDLQKDEKAKGINYVCIYSDSKYVVDNFRNAIFGNWQDREWKTLDGNDVDNKELWKDLIREVRKIGKRVEIFKIKGHSGNQYNEKANELAIKSRKNPFNTDFHCQRTQIRNWLPIPEVKLEIDIKSIITFFIQRTDPRNEQFEAYGQILRPKKYFGVRLKIRGIISDHALRGAHIYKIKLKKIKDSFVIIKIIKDLGKSSENKKLLI